MPRHTVCKPPGWQMTPLEQCRALLADAAASLGASVPPGREAAILALLRAGDPAAFADTPTRGTPPGWNLALRLCLEASDDGSGATPVDPATLDRWADRFLAGCAQLAQAELALARCAAGSLQLQQRGPREYVAWATSQRLSPDRRERADLDWWSAHLARQSAPDLAALLAERPQMATLPGRDSPTSDGVWGYVVSGTAVADFYRRLGRLHLARFACQHSYPADATLGGATFARYGDILALLIGWLHLERDRRAADGDAFPAPQDEARLVAAIAAALDADTAAIGRALQPFILDRENAAYHGSPLGQAAPPLIRLDERRVVWSARGLLGEPFIFLARELRRRDAREYHNSASLREQVFRRDLYRLFDDRRFVPSPGRVELKRSREARTDLDALIFDRKTGALGVFELKAQDPFARSVEERQRQRDHFFHANRQVSATVDWIKRHGPDDLLARFGERTARQFRVQKVHIFVLGRYLAHFAGGPEPDRRAAWGSWPRVLQLVGQEAFGPHERNPLGTLFARLRDAPPPLAPATATETIAIGNLRLRVYSSFAALKAEEDRRT